MTSDASYIRIERDGAVGHLVMDRPDRFNSMDVKMAQDLRAAGLKLARDESVRAVVFRGTGGKAFCAGADLKYIRAGGVHEDLDYLAPVARPATSGFGAVFKQILEYLHSTISEIRRSPKPWVAAVDGVAAAGGLGLAMACDLVVCSERSSFGGRTRRPRSAARRAPRSSPPPRRVSAGDGDGAPEPAPRRGAGARVGARERGLPDGAVRRGDARLGRRLAEGPSRTFAQTKALMSSSALMDRIDWHLDQELEELARSADSADFTEGVDAFFGKRAPKFTGR